MQRSSSRFSQCRRIVAAFIACCVGAAATQANAVDYTWFSASTGGSWSVTTNWTPTGAPTSGDTALLGNATANRTVFYDTAASGTLTGLSFTQTTSGVLNELRVRRTLAVTNALVLGASSGTAQLTLAGTSAANITGTFSGGITVNSGGVLSLANFNPAGRSDVFNANLTGNVTVSGGRLDFSWVKEGTATSSANNNQLLTGNLTMSSGTIAFDNPASGDRRLQITGDVSITGGRFTTNAASGVSNIRYDGANILFAPASYDSARFQISLQRNGDQTYSGSTAIQVLIARGTGIKTVSNSGTVGTLQMMDADGNGRSATTLKLASNVTTGTNGLIRAGFSDVGTTLDYGVDADIYTLDLTAATGAWTPTTAASTVGQWALTGTAGRIIANGFVLNTASVGTTVGPGLILESRAGNSVANNLSLGTSGTGTIDPTSVFRYAGAAVAATPSTLTSTRAIGILEVTSGALQVASLPSLAGARLNGGTLIATSSSALPNFGSAGFVAFGGGTLQLPVDGSAWTMSQVDTIFTNATKTSGALAIDVASGVQTQTGSGYSGGIGVTKLGSGTLALTAANTYTGTTAINAGVLSMGDGSALGSGTVSFGGGTLQYGSGVTTDISSRIASGGSTIVVDTGANEVTWASSIASSNNSGLRKLGAGTLSLTAANAYTGATTIAAGTLALTGGDNRIAAGGTLAFTGNAGLNISGSQSLATVTVADNVAATVAGGGRLTLTGASLQIGGTATQSLNATGLASFAYTNATGTMTVGGADLAAASSGAVVLPASAAITASALRIGANIGNSAVNSGTLTLGADTTISSSTITLGSNLAQGTINVAAGTVNPVLRLRGSDGTSAVSDMTIGTSLTGYGLTTASRVDLTSGTGTSTLDALVTNLVIGQSTRSTSFSVPINTSGGLLMQSGTLTATTITLGQTLNSPTFSASGQVISGSLSVSGGTVNVGTLFLADQNWTSGTVTGNFRLDGGGTLNAGTIASGTGAGAGSAVRTFTWNDGTIANLDASTDLSIGSGITFNLASTGTRRFSLSTGRSGTVASVLAGAGGSLEKVGAGTLVLAAVNTYTGTTTVSAGTLQVGGGTTGRITGDTLVNTGGRLLLTNVSGTLGNVAVAGGRMDLSTNLASIGALSMTSGTVGLSNGSNLRLSVWGDTSITGGSVVEPGTNGVINFYGTTNVFAPQTFSTAYSFQLHASGNQTFSGSTALGALRVRGTGIKTVSNSGTISDISFINDTAGSPVTMKLGSNIAVGATGMNLAGFSQQGTALAFGVDADIYTLDLTAATGAWTPATGGTGTTALWTLTGTAGRIIANGFNLSSARVDSSVGPGLILESRAGNSVANNLSVGAGSGTIDPASVFRYAGSADVATPSTLTSSRAIGDLEVASGALRISSLAGLQNLRVTGGTLDLNNLSLSVTSGSFGGGSVTSGTLTSATFLATSGSVAASLAGVGGTLTKSTAGTFTLTGANTFTGVTEVNAGTLAFDRVSALESSSGIGVAAGAILDYTGGAGTLSRNVTVSSSGTGTIRNSGGQKLTLAGTLTKDGRVLRLTGGTFDVTGTIVGSSANSDLLVDGASTVTLLSANTYNGPTFVNQASTLIVGTNNAIPFNSTVTLGNGTSRGTLDLGGNTNAIGGLAFSGSGGTVRMAANQTAGPQVSTSAGLTLGSNASLDLTGMGTTAGNYRLISSTGITGTFGSVTGLNSNYLLRYGDVNANEVSAQRKAEFGTITATPAAVKIITGGSTAISYTVANLTPTDGSTLSFTSSNGSNVVGSSNGTADANATSASISGLVFTGTTVGLGQTGSFTLTDPNAITTTANGSVSVDVLNHSLASFASTDVATKSLNFGTYDAGSWSGGDGGNGSLEYSLFNITSLGFTNVDTAGLNFYDWEFASGDNVFSVGFESFANLAAGNSNNFFATVASPGSLAEGSYTGTYTLKFRDQQDLSGATNTRDLSLTMNVVVVPEPGTLALAGLGIAAAAWARRRSRKKPGTEATW